jgi:hypothetical protein
METRLNRSAIGCIATLHNNPFLFAPIFAAFYKELGFKERSSLLAYLVLPLVLPKVPRRALGTTTMLRTFASEPERTYGLAARIAEWRHLTHLSLQQNIDEGVLVLDDSAAFIFKETGAEQEYCPPDMLKAAAKFAKICAPHSIPAIYLQFGIKRL